MKSEKIQLALATLALALFLAYWFRGGEVKTHYFKSLTPEQLATAKNKDLVPEFLPPGAREICIQHEPGMDLFWLRFVAEEAETVALMDGLKLELMPSPVKPAFVRPFFPRPGGQPAFAEPQCNQALAHQAEDLIYYHSAQSELILVWDHRQGVVYVMDERD